MTELLPTGYKVRVTGSWLVRLGTLCCFHYKYVCAHPIAKP